MPVTLIKRARVTIPLALITIFLFLTIFSLTASAAVLGDVNDDGFINVQDVVLVNSHVLGLTVLTNTQKIVADVNGDGIINVLDVTLITQMSLGLIDEFPILTNPTLSLPADNTFMATTSINFQWTASSGANMYQLEISRVSDGVIFKNPVLTNVTTSTQIGFPNDGTEYRWRVRAGSNNVWGTWAGYRTFTNGAMPAAPALLSPAADATATGESIKFEWAASSGASKYELEVIRVSDSAVFKSQVLGNITFSTQTGFLDDGTQYKWRVRAGNNAGWGAWTAYRNFINGALAGIPVAPTLISPADNTNALSTSITFEWALSSGANKYELEIRKAADDSIFRAVTLDNVSASIQSGFKNDGTQYKWRVRAGNNLGWSTWSGYRLLNNGVIPATPLQLTPINNATIAGRSISFSWTASGSAEKYQLEIIRASDGVVIKNELLTGTTSTIVDQFPNDGTLYRWQVRAGNKHGWSNWSGYRNFTNGSVIAAPALVSPASNTYIHGNSIMFEWKLVSEANRYELEIINAGNNSIFRSIILGNTSASIQMNFPDDGTQYKWRVRGGNDSNWGLWSEERYFINGNLLTAPALLSPADYVYAAGESIEFIWGESAGATKYQLELVRARDSQVIKIQDITTLNVTSTTQSIFLNDGTQYKWRVRGGNNIGWGAWSGYWNFINETPELDLAAPVLSLPKDDTLVNGDSVSFQWDSTATRYNLQVVRARDGVVLHDVVTSISPSVLPDFPNDGTKYLWRVRAGDVVSWGRWSFYNEFTNGFWWLTTW